MEKFTHVDTIEKLVICCKELEVEKILGVDLECENGLHHYGTFITLLQVSSKTKNYIIDVFKLEHIDPFVEILENRSIEKIFHDVSFDFRILNDQFKCVPKNVFDTQLAANFLLQEKLGLGNLLEKYFNLKKEKKFQTTDWTRRPLSRGMLDYAIEDSCHLIDLRNIIKKELRDLKLLAFAEEEFYNLEQTDWKLERQTFDQLKGYKQLSDSERAILKRLFEYREKAAMKVNRPTYFVINTKLLMDLAKRKQSLAKWETMRGVHPVVRQMAKGFFNEQEKGKVESIAVEKKPFKRMNNQQRQTLKTVTSIRDQISADKKIVAHLIANKDQLREIALGNTDCLRHWQKTLLKL